MSLMQLLAVGQSLRPIKDRPSRYRMRQQTLLPKFRPSPPPGQPSVGTEPGEPTSLPAPPKATADAAPHPQAGSSATPVPASGPRPTAAAVPAQPYPAGRWSLQSWAPFKRAGAAQPAKVPIQGELSLEAVRPVRNDLSDSDLEVVPAPRPTSLGRRHQPASGEPTRDPAQARSPLWNWLRRRLLQRLA